MRINLTSEYTLSGMDCPGCAKTIEKYCKKIAGVDSAEVNYSSSTLKIQYDTTETKKRIESGVTNLGFKIEEINKTTSTNRPMVHEKKDQNEFLNIFKPIVLITFIFILFSATSQYSQKLSHTLLDLLTLFCLFPIFKKIVQYFKVGFYFSVEFLMFIAVIGALFINASQEAVMVMILFRLGEALEGYTSRRASRGIEKLSALIPEYANLVLSNNSIQQIKASEILENQIILAKPSERFPADGLLIEGESYVDESFLTGESFPVRKKINQKIYAGSLNTDSSVKILTTQVGKEHSVARLIQLVRSAQDSKSRTLRLIENFSQYYTPSILIIALAVTVLLPLLGHASWYSSIYKGLSILLIGCPCALIISTPSAIAAGISAASNYGILIKNASALEIIGRVKTMASDKTGTLTEGKIKITDVISFSQEYNSEEILRLAFSLEQHSTHPLAKSICLHAKDSNINPCLISESKTVSGIGVSGKFNDNFLFVTSPVYAMENNYIPENKINFIESLQSEGKIVCTLNFNDKCIGLIALQDRLKAEVKIAIDSLKKLKININILTGDHKKSAETVAGSLNVNIMSQLLPEQKLDYIREFAKQGKVAMVGDGINDAPSLAAADVGIAMGGGTDIAVDSAQIVIANKNIFSWSLQ